MNSSPNKSPRSKSPSHCCVNDEKEGRNPNLKLKMMYEEMLMKGTDINVIKKMILFAGVPDLTQEEKDNAPMKSSLRGKLWKVLLGVTKVDGLRYLELIKRGPCVIVSDKIGNDVGRTFAKGHTDTKKIFEPLYRLLNAFAHLTVDKNLDIGYVQGLNCIAALFLHVMPEPDAFECFCSLILKYLPRYYTHNVEGAYDGLHLVPFCLSEVDPTLFSHLSKRNFHYETLLEFVLSLGSSNPPLEETLKLWDFLFAFGFQMVPLIPVAYLVRDRAKLLSKRSSTTAILYNSRDATLNAKVICDLICMFAKSLSSGLWELLIHHTYDENYHRNVDEFIRYLDCEKKG